MILASQSPRRRELIALISPEFRVIPAQGEEILPEGISPEQAVLLLSRQKADEVRQREFPGGGAVPETIVAADTVVAIDGEILGKPHSAEDAAEMLRAALRQGAQRLHRGHGDLRGGVRFLCGADGGGVLSADRAGDRLLCRHRGAYGQGRCLRDTGQGRTARPEDRRGLLQRHGTSRRGS